MPVRPPAETAQREPMAGIPPAVQTVGSWRLGDERTVFLLNETDNLSFAVDGQKTPISSILFDTPYAVNLFQLFRRTIEINLQRDPLHSSCFLPQFCRAIPGGTHVALFGHKEPDGALRGLRWGVVSPGNNDDQPIEVTDPVSRDFVLRAPSGKGREEMASYTRKFQVTLNRSADSRIETIALRYQRDWYETAGKTSTQALIDYLSDPTGEAPLETLVQLGLSPAQIMTHFTADEARCFQTMLTSLTQLPENVQKKIIKKFLELYPTISSSLFPHVVSINSKHLMLEFILQTLTQDATEQNPNIRLISRTLVNTPADPRCNLLNILNQHRMHAAGARELPPPVTQCEDLTVAELTNLVSLYLKIEQMCGPLTPANADLMWKAVETSAFRRDFFPPIAPEAATGTPIRPTREDIQVYDAIRLLSLYPDLKKRFAVFENKICGMIDLKLSLLFDVLYPLCVPEARRMYGLTPVNGILLYGPPGCGKTFFANTIAEAMGGSVVTYSAGRHGSKWANETENTICKMFDEAEEAARSGNPSVIFIDESSSVFPKREGLSAHQNHVEKEVNEFLQRMEGCGSRRVLIVGATNHPLKIDEAALRSGRLEHKFYLSPPDRRTRLELFRWYAKNRPMQEGIDYDQLAANSERFVSSDIKLVMDAAARAAALRRQNITSDMINTAIHNTQPSLTAAALQTFEQVQARMNPPR